MKGSDAYGSLEDGPLDMLVRDIRYAVVPGYEYSAVSRCIEHNFEGQRYIDLGLMCRLAKSGAFRPLWSGFEGHHKEIYVLILTASGSAKT